MKPLDLFIPITKIDVEKRLIYGVVTAENEDRSGEICDYESTKPFYEKWSKEIHKASDGKSLGNLRAMHGKVAAGKVTSLAFDDAGRKIEICAKVVDPDEWDKVREGVYTGFSQGGAYVRRWTDETGRRRYTADPHEISLVDAPCLPEATFQIVKTGSATGAEAHPPQNEHSSLDKIGARNSKADLEHLQRAHDELVKLGARCASAEKFHGPHRHEIDFEKLVSDQEDMCKAVSAMAPALEEILQTLRAMSRQPSPAPASMARPVSKSQDAGGNAEFSARDVARLQQEDRELLAREAIRLAQQRPMRMGARF